MPFRAKAFSLHLLVSASVLTLVLATLYLGWYHWPGWYLVGAVKVAVVMAMVDVGLGPLATLVVANPKKPRVEFRRDLSIIAFIQIVALAYGTSTLWNGRPLFYTFSADRLEVVQASAIDDGEIDLARSENPAFVPSWHSLPEWVWAPLPADQEERTRIVESALQIGKDVIAMPRYFRPWEQGASDLRAQLKAINELSGISKKRKAQLEQKMAELGDPPERNGTILFDGRGVQAVAVFDRSSLELRAILTVEY